ncbi:PIG-L deacetylase family protein [Paracoccus tegillarcae]|uniref:PIG-L family deacetylase n=1 Tax=Paracoccus tegillarcae TaxID=1529068 RepID=A0A2K9F220_9RHOB|nr:PIG-L deacetylase family protein [Paracoccus tegillarcae]AUH33181.1 hypothetical protein CUV01_07060 [Paracoccus tegillarcae]
MLIKQSSIETRTALTVLAHPDDAELACFGLLAKLRKNGWRVVICIVTRGENGADPTQWDRLNEARVAAALIDAEIVVGDFIDGFVPRTRELISWTEAMLVDHRPDLIVSHHVGESRTAHQDHVAVEAAVQIAVRRTDWLPTLLLAEDTDHDPAFRPNWFVDITDEFETKLAAIEMHSSQSQKYYMRSDYQKLRSNRWALNFTAQSHEVALSKYYEAYFLVQQVN